MFRHAWPRTSIPSLKVKPLVLCPRISWLISLCRISPFLSKAPLVASFRPLTFLHPLLCRVSLLDIATTLLYNLFQVITLLHLHTTKLSHRPLRSLQHFHCLTVVTPFYNSQHSLRRFGFFPAYHSLSIAELHRISSIRQSQQHCQSQIFRYVVGKNTPLRLPLRTKLTVRQ